jgi:hypothetical protein
MTDEKEKRETGADRRRQDLTCCLVTAVILVVLFFVLVGVAGLFSNRLTL